MKHALRDERILPIFIHSEIDDYGLSPNGFRVYAHLARRAGKGNAWPSYQSIGDHCFGMVWENPKTRRQRAMDAIRELVGKGLIAKETRKADDGDNLTNIYTLSEPPHSVPPGTNGIPSGTIAPKGTPLEGSPEYISFAQPSLLPDDDEHTPLPNPSLVGKSVVDEEGSTERIEHTLPRDYAKSTPTPQQELFEATCKCIGWDYRLITKEQAGQVAHATGVLKKAGYTVADLHKFHRYWFAEDWRGKKGQFPTLTQLRAEIGKAKPTIAASTSPFHRIKDLSR